MHCLNDTFIEDNYISLLDPALNVAADFHDSAYPVLIKMGFFHQFNIKID